MPRPLAICSAVLAILGGLIAQPMTLSTGFAGGSGQAGVMFDVVATSQVRVLALDLHLESGFHDLELFTRDGSHVGVERDPGAWTSLGTVADLAGEGVGRATRLPLDLCQPIAAGATRAFYVHCASGPALDYSIGSVVGAVAASDANLSIREGTGNAGHFGAVFQPREWNGTLHYETGTGGGPCTPVAAPEPPPWQRNPHGHDFAIDGVRTDGYARARVTACPGALFDVDLSHPAGRHWDLAYQSGTLPANGQLTPGGSQRIHLDISGPPVNWLFGVSALLPLAAPPIVLRDVPIVLPGDVSAQVIWDDPSAAEGFLLSQGLEIELLPSGGSLTGPTRDDEVFRIDLFAAPLCVGEIGFAGTRHREAFISSNGRVQFESGDLDWSPSVAEALTGGPFVGVWGDLDPGSGGAVVASATAGTFATEWRSVPPFFGGGGAASFRVAFAPGGAVSLEGVGGQPLATGLANWRGAAFLGLSIGLSGGATDAGPTAFLPGSGGSPSSATDMIYALGPANALLAGTGIMGIDFSPRAGGGYDFMTR